MNKQLCNVKINKNIIQTLNDHFAHQTSQNKQIFIQISIFYFSRKVHLHYHSVKHYC